MKDVKIAWSGITGRTGMEALARVKNVPNVKIVAGLMRDANYTTSKLLADVIYDGGACGMTCRQGWFELGVADYLKRDFLGWTYKMLRLNLECGKALFATLDMDVIVDFSHPSVFDTVLDLAVRTHVPLISGTSGLVVKQMNRLQEAAKEIPIFRGGNFRFKVKKFLDDAVALAKDSDSNLTLYENFYEGKSFPSETAKVLRHKIQEATGKVIGVSSRADLPKEDLECQWQFGNVACKTEGFGELAENVLQIARIMATKKPKGSFYELDDIWEEVNL